MYRQKIYVLILRERAKRASASETYISGLKYICIHIQSVQFPFITYGIWRYKRHTDKTLSFTFSHSKTAIPSIFCWYFRYFVSETHSFNVPTTNICTYIARASLSETYIFRTQIYLHTYTINAVSFNYLWYGAINYSLPTNH